MVKKINIFHFLIKQVNNSSYNDKKKNINQDWILENPNLLNVFHEFLDDFIDDDHDEHMKMMHEYIQSDEMLSIRNTFASTMKILHIILR